MGRLPGGAVHQVPAELAGCSEATTTVAGTTINTTMTIATPKNRDPLEPLCLCIRA